MALKPGFSGPALFERSVTCGPDSSGKCTAPQRVSEAVLESERLFVRSRACFIRHS
ncbi:hypothetical protein QT989_23475 [Microcoleus sp. SVA1_B6]